MVDCDKKENGIMSDNNEMKSNECIRQPMEMINDNKVRNETVLQSLSKFSDVLSAQKKSLSQKLRQQAELYRRSCHL